MDARRDGGGADVARQRGIGVGMGVVVGGGMSDAVVVDGAA